MHVKSPDIWEGLRISSKWLRMTASAIITNNNYCWLKINKGFINLFIVINPDSKWKLGQHWVLSCNFRWANVGCAMQNHPHFAHPKNVGPTCCTNVGPTCCTNVGPTCCTNVGPTCFINVGPTCFINVGPTCWANVGPTCWANVGSLLASGSC